MPPSELDIWILAGQSNMQGCGLLQGYLEPDERVWNYTSAGQWEVGCEPLHRLWESCLPAHQNILRMNMDEGAMTISDEDYAKAEAGVRTQGAGLGLAFGRAMADATGRPVGLISAAHGGTSLEFWDFRRRDEGGESIYGAMLERTRTAIAAGGILRGLLWYQGESDALDPIAGTYLERFKEWIEAVREDLGRPDLPVISAQIGNVVVPPALAANGWQAGPWEQVRQALLEIPQHVPHTTTTATVDLGLDDTIHIDTPGLIRLGKRMARLALGADSPRVVSIQKEVSFNGLGQARLICEGVDGSWKPRHHISGFETRTADGQPHPTITVIKADADTDDPRNIRILFNEPLDDTVLLGYGLGLNPYCNAVDEADMPLCAFLPIGIAG